MKFAISMLDLFFFRQHLYRDSKTYQKDQNDLKNGRLFIHIIVWFLFKICLQSIHIYIYWFWFIYKLWETIQCPALFFSSILVAIFSWNEGPLTIFNSKIGMREVFTNASKSLHQGGESDSERRKHFLCPHSSKD